MATEWLPFDKLHLALRSTERTSLFGGLNTEVERDVLEQANATVDGYILGRYANPSEMPSVETTNVRTYAIFIYRYLALGLTLQSNERVTADYEKAISALTDIKDGKIPITNEPVSSALSDALPQVVEDYGSHDDDQYTREALEVM